MVVSDNGPLYLSEAYTNFASQYEFEHISSSPLYTQVNGEAEHATGKVKTLFKKDGDPYLALLAYGATPLQNEFNPAELLMSRKLHTTIPHYESNSGLVSWTLEH